MPRLPIVSTILSGALLVSTPARAQDIRPFIERLFFQGIVDDQEDPEAVLRQARDSADELSKFTAAALATVPVVSSSAGLVYVGGGASGPRRLKTPSFGPSFVERPLTNGKSVFNLGVNYQFTRIDFSGAFDTADGRDDGLPLFDNTATFSADGFVQFITKRAFLETRSHSFNIFTSYGITPRLDVGAVVPITALRVTGRTEETFDVTRNWDANDPAGIRVDRPTPTGTKVIFPETRLSATGFGDVSLRVKYSLVERGGEGAALLTELRLPTGDEANLLGAGEPSFKVAFLGAMNTIGEASLHTNGGYTVGGLSDEIVFAAGIDGPVLAQQRVTASLSFLGRSLRAAGPAGRVGTVRRVVNTGPTGERSIVVDRFFWSQDQLSFFQLAAGAKVNLGGDWLLSGTVLIPLNRTGFQPGITPAVGIERKWGDPQ